MNPSVATTLPSGHQQRQSLQAAFDEFNRLSRQLQQSYEDLQQRTGELNLNWLHQPEIHQHTRHEPLASRIEILLATLPAGVVVVNRAGIILTANRAAEQFFGAHLPGKILQQVMNEYVGLELYKSKVSPEVAASTSYFKDALNEILAGGEQIF